jgi:hypothetical protein
MVNESLIAPIQRDQQRTECRKSDHFPSPGEIRLRTPMGCDWIPLPGAKRAKFSPRANDEFSDTATAEPLDMEAVQDAKKRSAVQQLAFRFGYAVSLHRGAERIAEKGDPVSIAALPVFLLLGFALENAFACYLIANSHSKPADYKSHDLKRAMNASRPYGLILSKEASAFVEAQTPTQKNFAFRYPEKLEEVSLPDVKDACKLVRKITIDIDVVLRMNGIDMTVIAEAL